MERSNTESLNGHNRQGTAVLEEKLLSSTELAELQTAPAQEVSEVTQDKEQVQPPISEPTPKKKNRKPLIFAVAGVAAIVAGNFGYHYWQYASTHEETDDATVSAHIHQVSSRINGTVSEVDVNDNQLVSGQ